MRFSIDTERRELQVESDGEPRALALYGDEAFKLLSDVWVKVGWSLKYQYGFSWLGRPVIQLPEDLIRAQEVVFRVKPDVIVETGVAHGGSLVFYATLCRAIGAGRVIGVDIEIRPHNRAAIEQHELAGSIRLIEGSSTDPAVIRTVSDLIRPSDQVMVILDANHTRQHVAGEFRAYAPLVTPGSYIVATDGVMRDLADAPRGDASWATDNPYEAVREFLSDNEDFELQDPPPRVFDESETTVTTTHWPAAYLLRKPEVRRTKHQRAGRLGHDDAHDEHGNRT